MKKLYFIVFVLLFSPVFALATSGVCSYHGGISCSAGSDYDGSVICADGWRDSSASYSDQIMCQNTQKIPICYIPVKKEFYCDRVSAIATQNGLRGSTDDKTAECEANQKQADLDYIQDKNTYTQCLTSITSSDTIKVSITPDEQCHQKYHDYNSHADGNNCVCNLGYTLYDKNGICELTKVPVVVPPPQQISVPAENVFSKILKKPAEIKVETKKGPLPQSSVEVKKTEIPVVQEVKIESKKTFWQKFIGFFRF